MTSVFKHLTLLIISLTYLTACSSTNEDFAPIEGERISIMELQESLSADSASEELSIPPAWKNEFWPQAGGYPNHSMQHLKLSKDLSLARNQNIGPGNYRNLVLTAQPIIIGGYVYTIDTRATVRALDINDNGKIIWQSDVDSKTNDEPVITGGLGYSNGKLYVTNGLNEIVALSPRTGKELWRKKIPSASQAAPTILDGRIYISTIDNRLLAMSEEDGSILWEYEGLR